MSLSGIRQSLADIKESLKEIDYSPNKPLSYLVFVPGLSLLIQKVQFTRIRPFLDSLDRLDRPTNAEAADTYNLHSRQYANICTWHLRGSIAQVAISALAVSLFANSWFLLPAALAGYELVDTFYRTCQNRAPIYTFNQEGDVSHRKVTFLSIRNIF